MAKTFTRIDIILQKPRVLRATTSFDFEEFEKLSKHFEKQWEGQHRRKTWEGELRQRARGAGAKGKLATSQEKLFFILFYFKVYPLQEVIAMMFGMSQCQANFWIHRLTPVVQAALGYELKLPERKPARLHEVLAQCSELKFVMDGTDRRVRRPKNKDQQKRLYSGKRKTHTKKNLLIVSNRQVKYLSQTRPGSVHDLRLTEEIARRRFPAKSGLFVDLGFLGYKPRGSEVWIPEKKPKGKPLPPWWKTIHRAMASVRVGVEHVISGIKRCGMVSDIFRNFKRGYDDLVMEVACGLHNFRDASRSQNA